MIKKLIRLAAFATIFIFAAIVVLLTISEVFIRPYLKIDRFPEAPLILRMIHDGEVNYYQEIGIKNREKGTNIPQQFLSAPQTPSGKPGIDKKSGDWDHPSWKALKWWSGPPMYSYVYGVEASGTGLNASFTAWAIGDLDGDGNTSYFARIGRVDSSGEVISNGLLVHPEPNKEKTTSILIIAAAIVILTTSIIIVFKWK